MKLLRLPSGQFFDTNKIIHTDEGVRPFNHKDGGVIFQVFVNYPTEDGVAVAFFDADARAMHAWLEINSVHIGEDGQEVVSVEHEQLPGSYVRFLKALKPIWPEGLSDIVAWDDYGLNIDDLGILMDGGYILSSSRGYIIRELGITLIDAN